MLVVIVEGLMEGFSNVVKNCIKVYKVVIKSEFIGKVVLVVESFVFFIGVLGLVFSIFGGIILIVIIFLMLNFFDVIVDYLDK